MLKLVFALATLWCSGHRGVLAGYLYSQPQQQLLQPQVAYSAPAATAYFERTFLPRAAPFAAQQQVYQPAVTTYQAPVTTYHHQRAPIQAYQAPLYHQQTLYQQAPQVQYVSPYFATQQPYAAPIWPGFAASPVTPAAPAAAPPALEAISSTTEATSSDAQSDSESVVVDAPSTRVATPEPQPQQQPLPIGGDQYRGFAYRTDFAGGAHANVVFFSGRDMGGLRFPQSPAAQAASKTPASDAIDSVAQTDNDNDAAPMMDNRRRQFDELMAFLQQTGRDSSANANNVYTTFYSGGNDRSLYESRFPANTRFLNVPTVLPQISPVYPILRANFARVPDLERDEPQGAGSQRQSKTIALESEGSQMVAESTTNEQQPSTSAADSTTVTEAPVATSTTAAPSTTLASTERTTTITTTTTTENTPTISGDTSSTPTTTTKTEEASSTTERTKMEPIVVMDT